MKERQANILKLLEELPQEKIHFALSLLTPLQRESIEILAKRQTSLSAFEIKKCMIQKWYGDIWFMLSWLHSKEIITIKEDRIEIVQNYPNPVLLLDKTFYPGPIDISLPTLIENFNAFLKNKEKTNQISTKEKLLKKLGVPVPSFAKIQSELNELVVIGVLFSLPSSKRNTRDLYAINPKIAEKLVKSIEKLPSPSL
ncbi:MAG TPA: hypothetical protein ENI49_04840 [Thermoplasmatales archaeon]|nr:hypothetical protein [Thermoplasmatales archaeon]